VIRLWGGKRSPVGHARQSACTTAWQGCCARRWRKRQRALGCTPWQVREAVAEGIARLLGPHAAGIPPRECSARGQSFVPSGAWPERRTCSAACERERRRQWQAGEPLRALDPATFRVLRARDQEVVRLYYGLDGEPLTSGEISERLGMSADWVRQLVRHSVVRLLGPAGEGVLRRTR
jgi:hypothetical protein